MTRVAAFDCGTNSLRLLIADVDVGSGQLVDVDRRMEIVRLGEGVDRTGQLSAAALDRAFRVSRFYAALCQEAGVERMRFVATSASRDARNAAEFVAGIQTILGIAPEVLTGAAEAHLSFVGATLGLAGDHPAPFLVVDIGGGSTEFVLGHADVEAAASVDVGCVRLTERHMRSDPPTAQEILAAGADIDAAVDAVARAVPLARARTLVGLAGSVTTLTAHALRLPAYDSAEVHGTTLSIDQIVATCHDMLADTRARRAELPFMHPGRVDVIGAGALIWQRVVQRVAAEAGIDRAVTSEHDILDGVAWALAQGSDADAGRV